MKDEITPEELAAIADLVGTPDTLVTATDLSDWLGLTANRVNVLGKDGTLPRRADGSFPLKAAVRAYAAHARAGAMGRRADVDLAAEKLRLAREQADKLALHNASARGELLDSREVANEWRGIVTDLRAAILAVPSRVAASLGLDRKATIALDVEIRAAMESIANDR